ncbi:eukaryotic translation initiation factor 3 subunit 7-domain-containing protein [Phakopsora pachyrhizi]|nr:eukaryotic translation initiation factor 3 subunit 7-domain-containing protein [Phakopsora pachyrhizi]
MVNQVVRLGQEVLENFAVNIGDDSCSGQTSELFCRFCWLVNVTIWPLMIITGLGLRGVVGAMAEWKEVDRYFKREEFEEAHVTVWVTRSGRKDDEEQMDGLDLHSTQSAGRISLVVVDGGIIQPNGGSPGVVGESADQMKMGYILRANLRDASRHVILGHQQFELKDFAYQINVNWSNGWGIVRMGINLAFKLPDRKSLLTEDPNKPDWVDEAIGQFSGGGMDRVDGKRENEDWSATVNASRGNISFGGLWEEGCDGEGRAAEDRARLRELDKRTEEQRIQDKEDRGLQEEEKRNRTEKQRIEDIGVKESPIKARSFISLNNKSIIKE